MAKKWFKTIQPYYSSSNNIIIIKKNHKKGTLKLATYSSQIKI